MPTIVTTKAGSDYLGTSTFPPPPYGRRTYRNAVRAPHRVGERLTHTVRAESENRANAILQSFCDLCGLRFLGVRQSAEGPDLWDGETEVLRPDAD